MIARILALFRRKPRDTAAEALIATIADNRRAHRSNRDAIAALTAYRHSQLAAVVGARR